MWVERIGVNVLTHPCVIRDSPEKNVLGIHGQCFMSVSILNGMNVLSFFFFSFRKNQHVCLLSILHPKRATPCLYSVIPHRMAHRLCAIHICFIHTKEYREWKSHKCKAHIAYILWFSWYVHNHFNKLLVTSKRAFDHAKCSWSI